MDNAGRPDILDLIQFKDAYLGRTEWPGLWRGRVEDVDDPERRGRMRVRVYAVHTEDENQVPVNRLPWAEPCFQDAGINYGEFHCPYRIGDMVWVMFEGGNADYPVWMGSWYGEDEIPEELIDPKQPFGYPHRQMVFKSRRGHKLEVSDEYGDLEIKLTDVKGNFIWLDTEENVLRIWWQGDKEEIITGNYTLCVDGNKTEVIGGDHNRTIVGDEKLVLTGTKHHSVQGDYKLTVGGNRAVGIGGNETVGVGGNMNHNTGGTINHNSASAPWPGEAVADKRLSDPEYIIQKRKPAFPDRISDYQPLHQLHYPYKLT